jgi:hypothetical protein
MLVFIELQPHVQKNPGKSLHPKELLAKYCKIKELAFDFSHLVPYIPPERVDFP